MSEYDFGDGWDVKLTLEDIFEDDDLPGKALPRVIAGEGYGIIEDCGGTRGLEDLNGHSVEVEALSLRSTASVWC